MRQRRAIALTAAPLLMLGLAACGGGGGVDTEDFSTPETAALAFLGLMSEGDYATVCEHVLVETTGAAPSDPDGCIAYYGAYLQDVTEEEWATLPEAEPQISSTQKQRIFVETSLGEDGATSSMEIVTERDGAYWITYTGEDFS